MPFMAVDTENSRNVYLRYEDHGSGRPVVLAHGWPLSGRSFERQELALLEAGYRVIAYDRRGFGDSSKPIHGYDYDTLARDLNQLLTNLDLRGVCLVGFSMGNGEVARYLGTYGADRIERAVFIAPILPYLLKTGDNPEGVDGAVFDEIIAGLRKDRLAFLTKFLANFYNTDVLLGDRLSEEVVRFSWMVAARASPVGTTECVRAWQTDFREDLASVRVPSLIIQGDADRILPIQATGERLHQALPGSRFLRVDGAPHGLIWTHAEIINEALVDFLEEGAAREAGAGLPESESHPLH